MATSVDPPSQDQAHEEPNVQYVLTGSGTTNDGKSLEGVVFVDPTTGLAMVPGSVTFTSLSIADGADAAEGATTDAATANTVIGRLKKLISLVPTALTAGGNLKTAILEALPAGTNLLGKVGIDQTTPGTTNAVAIDQTTPGMTNAVESNHYGTPSAAASVSVGTASTAVLAANASRKLLVLCNDSANTIYVDLSGAAAVASKGVRLSANGGSLLLDRYVPTSAITAIATGASSVLTIQEG